MTPADRTLSRRDFFNRLIPARGKATVSSPSVATQAPASAPPPAPVDPAAPPPPPPLAVIAGRHCLAYQNSFCSVCRERCPVPGAVVIERGFPRIVASLCTGCRVCHDVCPAPVNAIRIVPRPAGLPLPPPPAASH